MPFEDSSRFVTLQQILNSHVSSIDGTKFEYLTSILSPRDVERLLEFVDDIREQRTRGKPVFVFAGPAGSGTISIQDACARMSPAGMLFSERYQSRRTSFAFHETPPTLADEQDRVRRNLWYFSTELTTYELVFYNLECNCDTNVEELFEQEFTEKLDIRVFRCRRNDLYDVMPRHYFEIFRDLSRQRNALSRAFSSWRARKRWTFLKQKILLSQLLGYWTHVTYSPTSKVFQGLSAGFESNKRKLSDVDVDTLSTH